MKGYFCSFISLDKIKEIRKRKKMKKKFEIERNYTGKKNKNCVFCQ
jgi:hypothetical protein